jgi:hypothetical protein
MWSPDGVAGPDWGTVFSLEQQARSLELIGRALVEAGYETEASLEELRSRIAEALAAQGRASPVPSAQPAEG